MSYPPSELPNDTGNISANKSFSLQDFNDRLTNIKNYVESLKDGIDLTRNSLSTDYYTKSELYTKTEVNTELAKKVDKDGSKVLSDNNFTDNFYKRLSLLGNIILVNIKFSSNVSSINLLENINLQSIDGPKILMVMPTGTSKESDTYFYQYSNTGSPDFVIKNNEYLKRGETSLYCQKGTLSSFNYAPIFEPFSNFEDLYAGKSHKHNINDIYNKDVANLVLSRSSDNIYYGDYITYNQYNEPPVFCIVYAENYEVVSAINNGTSFLECSPNVSKYKNLFVDSSTRVLSVVTGKSYSGRISQYYYTVSPVARI